MGILDRPEALDLIVKNGIIASPSIPVILTGPTPAILATELPQLARDEGITSVKLYMTYDALRLPDGALLRVDGDESGETV
jgi:hypothetical protein